MANIDDGFRVEKLSLDDLALIGSGIAEPNIGGGYEAPQGSLYLRQNGGTDGQLWIKTGPADVDWALVQAFNPLTSSGGISTASTGIVSGGELSINSGDATKFDIAAGTGIIVDHETDPLNPTFELVSWSTFTAIPATFIGVASTATVLLDITGSIVQQLAPADNLQHKTHIHIGILDHELPVTSLIAVFSNPDPAYGGTERLADLSRALGPINVNGNSFTSVGTTLQLQKSSGNTHAIGSNFANSIENPDTTTDALLNPASFIYSWQDGTGLDFTIDVTPTTLVVPGLYDDGTGILATVPNGRWTVQVVHYFAAANEIRIEYGQKLFSTQQAALDILPDPDHSSDPIFGAGVVRAYLVLHSAATDLSDISDAKIVEGAKFGAEAGGQFSSSITDLQLAYDNSTNPEIMTDAVLGALTIKEGPLVGGNLFEGKDDADTTVFSVDTTGALNDTSIDQLNDVDTLTVAPTANDVLTWSGTEWVSAAPPGAGGGEANTGSNIGTAGVGVFVAKVGVDLRFKNINTTNNLLTITDDTANDEIDLTVNEANISITESQISDLQAYSLTSHTHTINELSNVLTGMAPTDGQVLTFDTVNGWQAETSPAGVTDHTLLSNIGTNTHAQIDTHISDTTIHFSSIDGLSDVTLVTPIDGNILELTGGQWRNVPNIAKIEVDNIELASGGIFDSNGEYDGVIVDATLTTVTSSVNLLDTLSQMEAAIVSAGTVSHFYHHNGAINQTFSTATIMLFNTAVRADAAFAYAAGTVTINTASSYRITYDVTFDATTNQQLVSETVILLNGTPVTGSRGYGYHRATAAGLQTVSGTAIITAAVTDTVEIQTTRFAGTQNITSIAEGCRLNIRSI